MSAQPLPQFEDHYIVARGVRIRYWQAGETGSPVLLLHGLNGCVEHWRMTIAGLMGAHRVWAIDGPGHGLSERDDRAFDPGFMRDLVAEFLLSQGAPKASIVALSGSGLVALKFALDRPEMLDRLVLTDAAGLGRGINFRMRFMSIAPMPPDSAFDVPMSREQLRYWVGQIFFADPSRVTDEIVDEFYLNTSRKGTMQTAVRMMRWGVGLLGQKHQYAGRLREIKAPTLVVWGKQDRLIPLYHARRAAQRIPNARLVVFDPCGHLPMTERPDDYNRVVLDFLAGR